MENHRASVVLLVEDECLVRQNAIDVFTDGGFEVLQAEHSAAAIIIALLHPRIDLLFTDVNMPGDMNGIGLAEHLFALRPELKIVITSALPLSRDVGHVRARFLPKPYSVLGLRGMAAEMLAA